jgi:hypothetical protein
MENEYAPGADTSLFGKKEQCVFTAAAIVARDRKPTERHVCHSSSYRALRAS